MSKQITHKSRKQTEATEPVREPIAEEVEIIQDELTTDPEEESDEESDDMSEVEYIFDPDTKTVTFQLVSGKQVVMQEPKPKQFLLMEDWARMADAEYKSPYFIMLKLALMCSDLGQSLEEFVDELDNLEDGDRVVGGLEFFPIAMQQYTVRLNKLNNRVNLQLSK